MVKTFAITISLTCVAMPGQVLQSAVIIALHLIRVMRGDRREQLIRVFSTSINFEIQKIARAPLWLSIFGVWVPGAVFSLLDPVLLSLLREEGREASSKVVVFVL